MFSMYEIMLGRPRCRNWIPLFTQQLRLRHLVQVIGYNIKTEGGSLYYTLHSTTMCAPFYTSEKIESLNPKWAELDINTLQNSSASGFVLRIWHHLQENIPDKIVLTWGICLSGLVYLGTKLSDIQPASFNDNSVIFQLNGGYYTNQHCVTTASPKPLPFIDSLNVLSDEDRTSIIRYASVKCAKSEVRISYNVKKLQRLQSLQQSIKNKTLDAEALRDKISAKTGMDDTSVTVDPLRETPTTSSSSHEPYLMSMPSLNRLLGKLDPPSKFERQEIAKLKKLIENAKFRSKMLSQERDRKLANLRHLNQRCTTLMDQNEDKNSELMSLYRHLSREMERLREWKRSQVDTHELYLHTAAQLHLRRKQLVKQLLLIYPIEKLSEDRYTITGVTLPDSESLNSVPEHSLSIALGYVSHTVVMCSTFLQVPLRYPLTHNGARSKISDHITYNIPDRERDFPLYTRGKDRLQFHYAIYLLNKNIAQLRWFCGMPTQDLRLTLPNLLFLLQGNADYRYERADSGFSSVRYISTISTDLRTEPAKTITKKYGSYSTLSPSLTSSIDRLDTAHISNNYDQMFNTSFRQDSLNATPMKKIARSVNSESGPGLSQILSSPGSYFRNTTNPFASQRIILGTSEINKPLLISSKNEEPNSSNCDNIEIVEKKSENAATANCVDCNIEQGLDILDPTNNMICSSQNEHSITSPDINTNGTDPVNVNKLQRRISRSVGSYTDDEKVELGHSNLEVGSDPLLRASVQIRDPNLSDQSLPNSLGEGRKEFLQHWFNNSSAHVCSEENLCPEFLGTAEQIKDDIVADNTLTMRTEALVQKTATFHLVKPRH